MEETLGTGLQDTDATHSFDIDITTNDAPLKVKIFNVPKLEMTINYHYIKEENLYVMDTQH